MDQQTRNELLKDIETIVMESQFRMQVHKGARAYHTKMYMQEKEIVQRYSNLYDRLNDSSNA